MSNLTETDVMAALLARRDLLSAALGAAAAWPVCERAADYATVVGIVRPWVAAHGPAAEASFFQGAARRAYGLTGNPRR
jgi:hypothetical protein